MSLWTPGELSLHGLQFQEYQFYDTTIDNHIDHAYQALALDETRSSFGPSVWERPAGCTTVGHSSMIVPIQSAYRGQIAKQVWFAGAHSDIGGGYAPNDTVSTL